METIAHFSSNKSIYDCEDGLNVEIIWFKKETFNSIMKCNKPIYEILKGKDLYDFLLGESIELPKYLITKYFTEVE
jgi:hypothetical protein